MVTVRVRVMVTVRVKVRFKVTVRVTVRVRVQINTTKSSNMSDGKSETAMVQVAHNSPLVALGQRFQIEPAKLIEVLRGTVIKPDRNGKQATNEEVAAFCIVANQYRLNPFTREIHAFTSGDKGVVPIVGIDGWTHIVNDCPGFDGCDFQEVADNNGNPVAVTCAMFIKDRQHAVTVTERFSECKRNTAPWQTMPWRMLRHKAYMQAARYAFGLSGIYDEDEARDIVASAKPVGTVAMPKPLIPAKNTTTIKAEKETTTTDNAPVSEKEDTPTSAPVVEADPEEDERRSKVEKVRLCRDRHHKKAFVTACSELGIEPTVKIEDLPLDSLQAILDKVDAGIGK